MPFITPGIGMAISGLAGGAGAAAGGKKGGGSQARAAQQAANQQFQIQSQQLQLGRDLLNTGMQAFTPAKDYWSSLLSGDPTKMAEATGPTADVIRQQQGTQQRALATLPAGGERNLAVAQAGQEGYNNLARLTAGVQPTAASALSQLASLPTGAGVGVMGQGAPNVGAGLKYNTHQQEQKGQNASTLGSGLGNLLYSTLSKPRGSRLPGSPPGGMGVPNP